MRRIYTLFAVLMMTMAGATNLSAQSAYPGTDVGGLNFGNDIIGFTDMYNLSFTAHNYGTARSMAMGNAFTALGADMVSASLNPAGIGMYLNSDFSLTPMMQFKSSPTEGGVPYYNDIPRSQQEFSERTNRFGMSSAGAVFTAYRGSGALTNFNVGFVYNRIADFNRNMLSASVGNSFQNSMANAFASQSNSDNLQTNADGTMPFGNDPYFWGNVLAYKNGVTNKDDLGWFVDRIAPTAEIDQYSAMETRGSIGEYALTFGLNFVDIFYFGATLGIQSVNYKRDTYYGENYMYGTYPSGEQMPYQLDYMNYMQRTRISGSGVNLKLGATLRPTKFLRIGVAYHTPTRYSLNMQYDAEMWSRTYSAGSNPEGYDINPEGYMYDNVYSGVWEDAGPTGWAFRSPSRLLTGVALTVAQRVILSVDYERSWYQNVKVKKAPIDGLYYPQTELLFKGSNTVRIGAEAMLTPFLALRAGYIWSGSTLRPEYRDVILSHPVIKQQSYITAGIGINFSSTTYLDIAYQYGMTHYTPFKTFYVLNDTAHPNYDPLFDAESPLYTLRTKNHVAVVTLGFRF